MCANLDAGANTVAVEARDGQNNLATKAYSVTTTGTGKTFEYDANGNLRYEKQPNGTVIKEYRWDQQNRLVRFLEGTHESVYEYDGESKRVRIKELTSSVETKNETFGWCGSRICQKRSGSTVLRNYFEQGFEQSGPTDYFYTRDHLGSVREVVGSNGTTVGSRLQYGPWGELTESGSSLTDFAYTSHHLDRASGLELALARGYGASLGRWLNRDPLGLAGGLNLYGYVGGDPVNAFDPSGESFTSFVNCVRAGVGVGLCAFGELAPYIFKDDKDPRGGAGGGGDGIPPSGPRPKPPGGGGGEGGGGSGGNSAGAGSRGPGGGDRDHGICELRSQLWSIDCNGKRTNWCRYYCPLTNSYFSEPYPICPPTVVRQSR